MKQPRIAPLQQRGAIALLLILILAVSATSYFLVKQLNGRSVEIERDKITAAALAQARDALIGRASSDPNRPGELPCPDINDDGKITVGGADTHGSNCATLIGRLPWYTLGLPDLRDGYGERLWYALSDNFHATGNNTPPLNTSTAGQLSISGTSPANAVIAIVFSPGPALGNQMRDGDMHDIHSNINNVQNYLEGDNANGDTVYETRNTSSTFNDKLLPITFNDLFSVVTRRVASEIGIQLASNFSLHNTLPNNLSFIPNGNWLDVQKWTRSNITAYSPSHLAPMSPPEATLNFINCAGLTYTIKIVNNLSQTTVSGHTC